MKIIVITLMLLSYLFADYKNINNDTLQDLKSKGVTIIDIRTQLEWDDSGVIPGSILITSHTERGFNYEAFKKELKAQGINDNFVLVCRSGSRSKELSERLNADGYKNFYNLQNGIRVWIYEKRKTTKSTL
ncbi:MAG: hypothetical protein RL154_1682 [Pseudomonadota bacterium]|jgi:rhodanese-related sulfurtransferase